MGKNMYHVKMVSIIISYSYYLQYMFVFAHSILLILHISLILEKMQMACNLDHRSVQLMYQKHILLQLKFGGKLCYHSQWYSEVNIILSKMRIVKKSYISKDLNIND